MQAMRDGATIASASSGATRPRYNAVFTIDVEDWYHGIELPPSQWEGREKRLHIGLDAILALLRESGTRGTFFVLGWIAAHHPDVVRKIAADGHEIGSHGYAHDKVYHLTPAEFREDIRKTKSILEAITGQKVVAHRSPFFSITQESLWALAILRDEGFLYDCSISPVKTWRYGIPSSPESPYRIQELDLIEFPVSTSRFLHKKIGLGGAYFRIFPYFLNHNAIRGLMKQGQPFMFYVHPWEYDPDHPVVKNIEPRARVTHYFNLRSTAPRTERLLRDCRFQSLGEAIAELQSRKAIPDVSLDRLKN